MPPKPEFAVTVRQSVTAGHIVCLDCGKHFSMLKRHLMEDHKLTPQQYRQRWELPARTFGRTRLCEDEVGAGEEDWAASEG